MLNHYFLKKVNRITLVEDKEIVSDSTKCAEIMNNFFSDAVFSLDVN